MKLVENFMTYILRFDSIAEADDHYDQIVDIAQDDMIAASVNTAHGFPALEILVYDEQYRPLVEDIIAGWEKEDV